MCYELAAWDGAEISISVTYTFRVQHVTLKVVVLNVGIEKNRDRCIYLSYALFCTTSP